MLLKLILLYDVRSFISRGDRDGDGTEEDEEEDEEEGEGGEEGEEEEEARSVQSSAQQRELEVCT